MIGEGVIALVWCAVGLSFYDSLPDLLAAIKAGSPSKVVYDSSIHFLGLVGGIFAVLGVVVLPITSGDTAFRAARLVIAEFFHFRTKTLAKRLYCCAIIRGWLYRIKSGFLYLMALLHLGEPNYCDGYVMDCSCVFISL